MLWGAFENGDYNVVKRTVNCYVCRVQGEPELLYHRFSGGNLGCNIKIIVHDSCLCVYVGYLFQVFLNN